MNRIIEQNVLYRICPICQQKIEHLQVRAGVRIDENTLVEGHYLCVKNTLGPARTLLAIEHKLLPMISDDDLVGGRLKKHLAILEGGRATPTLVELERGT